MLGLVATGLPFSPQPTEAAAGDRFYFSGVGSSYNVGDTFVATVHVVASPSRTAWLEFQFDCGPGLETIGSSKTGALPNMYGGYSPGGCSGSYTDEAEDYLSGDMSIARVTFRVTGSGTSSIRITYSTGIGNYPDNTTGTRTNSTITVASPTCPSGQVGTPPNCSTPPPPPTDVCPNIAGVQTSVPTGMVKDGAGNCVTPSAPPPSGGGNNGGGNNGGGNPSNPPSNSGNPSQPPVYSPGTGSPSSGYNYGSPSGTGAGGNPISQLIDGSASDPIIELGNDKLLENVMVTSKMDRATITFGAREPLTGVSVSYGEVGSKKMTDITPDMVGSQYSATIPKLNPKSTYIFKINGKTGDGKSATASGRFTTVGYPVGIYVMNGKKVLSKQVLSINGRSYETGNDGEVYLDAAAGTTLELKTTVGNKDYSSKYTVKAVPISDDGLTAATQEFRFDLAALKGSTSKAGAGALILIIFLTLLLMAGFAFIVKRRLNHHDEYATATGAGGTDSWNSFMQSVAVASGTQPGTAPPPQIVVSSDPTPPVPSAAAAPPVVPPPAMIYNAPPQGDGANNASQPVVRYTGSLASGIKIPHTPTVKPPDEPVEDMYEEARRTHRFE